MKSSSLVPPLRPGNRVRTQAIFPYRLPKGLRAGTAVTVVRIEGDTCIVRTDAGGEWTVPAVSLDPGELIWHEGRWVLGVA